MTSLLQAALRPSASPAGKLTFLARNDAIGVDALSKGSLLRGQLERLRGRCLLLATGEQLPTALALLELDGLARRIVLCTPDLDAERLATVARIAEADAVVHDGAAPPPGLSDLEAFGLSPRPDAPLERPRGQLPPGAQAAAAPTEWILLTSGTTGAPKLVLHTLESLAGALPGAPAPIAAGSTTPAREVPVPVPVPAPAPSNRVWSTFYDIRRYGGMQIYLRAVLGGVPLVLSSAGEPTVEFLGRAGASGVTHISGTPSHWRKALMSGEITRMQPEYVRLSGEIADQPVLDSLRAAFPRARIAHAFASTEAGVAFDVEDGRAGFPAELIDGGRGAIDMKVEDGTLRIRSTRNAARYLGDNPTLAGADGYVDTGDLVELRAGRYYFNGRKGGVINVGGLKVFPEEVESVINADPRVRMSLVRARRNPITGAVVVADVVLADPAPDGADAEGVKKDLLQACRAALAAHKVPTSVRFVPALELTAAGKLVRPAA